MSRYQRTKLIREGRYAAEVIIEVEDTDDGWSPTLALDDAFKLDVVREALGRDDLVTAAQHAKLYVLTPVTP